MNKVGLEVGAEVRYGLCSMDYSLGLSRLQALLKICSANSRGWNWAPKMAAFPGGLTSHLVEVDYIGSGEGQHLDFVLTGLDIYMCSCQYYHLWTYRVPRSLRNTDFDKGTSLYSKLRAAMGWFSCNSPVLLGSSSLWSSWPDRVVGCLWKTCYSAHRM